MKKLRKLSLKEELEKEAAEIEKELAEGELVEIPLPFPIHRRNIGFAYLDNLQQTTAVREFIEFYNTKQGLALNKLPVHS